jgi:hypothetical protein
LTERVDKAIDASSPVTDIRTPWFAYLSAAAVIVLLLGVSALTLFFDTSTEPTLADISEEVVVDGRVGDATAWASLLETDDLGLDDEAVEMLMYDYSAGSMSAGSSLLGDLSADELQYLNENFNVEDIL